MNRSADLPASSAQAADFVWHAGRAIARCASRGCRDGILCLTGKPA